MIRKIALAYSGGLDTSIIVPWLRERYDAEIICVAAEIGQGDELEGIRAKAIASGADECFVGAGESAVVASGLSAMRFYLDVNVPAHEQNDENDEQQPAPSVTVIAIGTLVIDAAADAEHQDEHD